MSSTPAPKISTSLWRQPLLNGWWLFALLLLPMTAAMLLAIARHDLNNPADISELIGYSVRWAVPFISCVVAASAMPVLFPSEFTRWWSRNRRYTGLVFAAAMAWQGLFIFQISTLHADYYYSEIYYLRDELEGTSGYLFLAAMVFTSFDCGRRRVSPAQWKVLHRSGVYFLWAYPFSVYWWNVFYYRTGDLWDAVAYWAAFFAFASRILAWQKRREMFLAKAPGTVPWSDRLLGGLLLLLGLVASATGDYWRAAVSEFLLAPAWSAQLELWLPFWPFEPFLPLAMMGIGAWIMTGSLRREPGGVLPATG